MTPGRPHIPLILLTLALAIVGCGELGKDWKGLKLMPPNPTSRAAVERLPEGSPQRAVMAWYAELQRGDAAVVGRRYASAARTTPIQLRRMIDGAAPFVRRVALRPPTDVNVRGRSATVFASLVMRWETPNGRKQEVRLPQAFTLIRERSAWRMSDIYFLQFARAYKLPRPRSG